MRRSFWAITAILILHGCVAPEAEKDYSKYVNTFIGTDGTGHTFPGPCMPFGLVQPGPDNADIGWDYTSGYQYADSVIIGFSQTRANGTGISELGDVLLQPLADNRSEGFGQAYDKSTERASPGYYTVTLNSGIRVELTCTERVALHRYTFPTSSGKLLVDLQHGLRFLTDSLVLESDVQVVDQQTISGYCRTRNWVDRKYFFTIQFSRPFVSERTLDRRPREAAPRYVFDFKLPDSVLQVKVALSTVSVAGAEANLHKELPGWDFASVSQHARTVWNQYLGRIDIEADEKQKEIFYSCMYRLFIQPSNITDVDGRYRGPDDSIRTARDGTYYSTLSLWDTHRAAHPLYTLIAPERVNGMVHTMIEHSKARGFLPIWTIWGMDNYCMIGNHAIPVIVDAYMKGFRGFDAGEAMRQMVKSTSENHINSNWRLLDAYGYYPFDSLDNEAVSRTLEHGVDDYSIALMGERMGLQDIASAYHRRASRYRNLYDSSTRLMRGRDSKGRWRTPFDPLAATSPMNNPGDYTEANAWQYFWTPAQYDVQGIMELLGGRKAFTDHLDRFFSIPAVNPDKHLGQEAMIGQYAHGNEPSHHIAYLYAYSDKPEAGMSIVSKICSDFYNNTPSGMIGNDDCGQMSAWYIFATLGFYPVNPALGEYVLGRPQVKRATLLLDGGRRLKISVGDRTGPVFNGRPVETVTIEHQELVAGGELIFPQKPVNIP